MDLKSSKLQPNSRDHPEVIEWMKRYSDAQYAYVGFNEKDPSNFLDEEHKQEIVQRLYDSIINASQELEKWCKYYGINYGSLDFKSPVA